MITEGLWVPVKDGDRRAIAIYQRHYSARHYRDGRKRRLFMGPGEKLPLMTPRCDALFGWRRFVEQGRSQPRGVNCSVFRREEACPHLASDLIIEADEIAWTRWPGERLYTYVDPEEVRFPNPGYCFKAAGWQKGRVTPAGLIELEIHPGTPLKKTRPVPSQPTGQCNDTYDLYV